MIQLLVKVEWLAIQDSLGHDHLLGDVVNVARPVSTLLQDRAVVALLRASEKVVQESILASSVRAMGRSIHR